MKTVALNYDTNDTVDTQKLTNHQHLAEQNSPKMKVKLDLDDTYYYGVEQTLIPKTMTVRKVHIYIVSNLRSTDSNEWQPNLSSNVLTNQFFNILGCR